MQTDIWNYLSKKKQIEYEEEEYQPVTLLYFYPLGAALGIAIVMLIVQILFSGLKQLTQKFRDD